MIIAADRDTATASSSPREGPRRRRRCRIMKIARAADHVSHRSVGRAGPVSPHSRSVTPRAGLRANPLRHDRLGRFSKPPAPRIARELQPSIATVPHEHLERDVAGRAATRVPPGPAAARCPDEPSRSLGSTLLLSGPNVNSPDGVRPGGICRYRDHGWGGDSCRLAACGSRPGGYRRDRVEDAASNRAGEPV